MRPFAIWHLWWAAPILLLSICGFLTGSFEADRGARFVPSQEVAEAAIQRGLEGWMNGEPAGVIPGTKPEIQFMDSYRKPEQKLVRYEILGEVAGNAPRCFAVRVTLKPQPDAPETTVRLKYIVVGIDPLWVFRQEDYDLLSHWEHPMEDQKELETPEK